MGKTIQGGAGYEGSITIEGSIIDDLWFTLSTVAAGAKLAIDGTGLQALEAIRTNCTTVTGGTAPTAFLAAFDRGE